MRQVTGVFSTDLGIAGTWDAPRLRGALQIADAAATIPTLNVRYENLNGRLALSGDTLSIYGDGRQRRDYIYIDDAVDALMRMAEAPESNGRLYNVGSGLGTPIVDMARSIIELAGGGRIGFVAWPKLAAQIETGDFVADIGRIQRELGWTPRVTLADGLERTISHYKSQLSSLKAHRTMRVES